MNHVFLPFTLKPFTDSPASLGLQREFVVRLFQFEVRRVASASRKHLLAACYFQQSAVYYPSQDS